MKILINIKLYSPITRLVCMVLLSMFVVSCSMVPSNPVAVVELYRGRMKSGDVEKARELLTEESRGIVQSIVADYKLDQSPEDLALLNALDPGSPPALMSSDEQNALIQVRTLRGGVKIIKLVKSSSKSDWKIDIQSDLQSLDSFLKGREALEVMREQAGEYAAGWKAFTEQLNKMNIVEPPKQITPKANDDASEKAKSKLKKQSVKPKRRPIKKTGEDD